MVFHSLTTEIKTWKADVTCRFAKIFQHQNQDSRQIHLIPKHISYKLHCCLAHLLNLIFYHQCPQWFLHNFDSWQAILSSTYNGISVNTCRVMPVYILFFFARILKTIKKKSNEYPNCRLSGICGHLHYPFSMTSSNRKSTKSGSKYNKKITGQACLDTEHILETIPD